MTVNCHLQSAKLCVLMFDVFHGTAPIQLTDNLHSLQ